MITKASSFEPPKHSIRLERWSLKALAGICSLKAFRGGPKILLNVAVGVVLLTAVTYTWSSLRTPGALFGSDYLGGLKGKEAKKIGDGGGGLRIVVFGGGDAATPIQSSTKSESQAAWTEIMCQELDCGAYLSFVPDTVGMSGAVMSNTLIETALEHVSVSTSAPAGKDNNTILDYSWVEKQYPLLTYHDLSSQVNAFLASPLPKLAPTETLWIFNVGYWDIWHLAALPRKLATEVLDSAVRNLFFHIEILYQAAQDWNSVAFSDFYSNSNVLELIETRPSMVKEVPRAPFRIFLTRLFDISLSPGFASARPEPPQPHSRSDQLRNAAFLRRYWDAVLEEAVDDWLVSPDPEYWSTADAIDIGVVKALIGKRSAVNEESRGKRNKAKESHAESNGLKQSRLPLPSREVASYDMSRYLQEQIIDRQLRNVDLMDHNGFGLRPLKDGFLDVSKPCISLNSAGSDIEVAGGKGPAYICEQPDDHLFYSDFIVSQRAINTIGAHAADQFLKQDMSSIWKGRAVSSLQLMRIAAWPTGYRVIAMDSAEAKRRLGLDSGAEAFIDFAPEDIKALVT
ncbi:hypothetical protein F5Y19DRAFT_473893 [Xylariaceae sp. FL1651]|nr:hypothetical protein F5Y19DRAFT_473893 [Xylariaceae sp. FL1651]